ncbi:hypothetical protein HQ533_03360 [Candidatus Woesearchaeota archaeon]|nr:hypothetical protein [Candidatus Woesearchaeota archaeon]
MYDLLLAAMLSLNPETDINAYQVKPVDVNIQYWSIDLLVNHLEGLLDDSNINTVMAETWDGSIGRVALFYFHQPSFLDPKEGFIPEGTYIQTTLSIPESSGLSSLYPKATHVTILDGGPEGPNSKANAAYVTNATVEDDVLHLNDMTFVPYGKDQEITSLIDELYPAVLQKFQPEEFQQSIY